MDTAFYESYTRKKVKYKALRARFGSSADINRDFVCVHCKSYVSAESLISGVQNRNHCPYCLHSRHMDLREAGDRLAACKSQMKPLGLTLKQSYKKYATNMQGELMLVHQCTECGRVSVNRIAADDDTDLILAVHEKSVELDEGLKRRLVREGIRMLGREERILVRKKILGLSLVE